MNFFEPIRDRKKIAQIKNQLRGQRRYRDLVIDLNFVRDLVRHLYSDFGRPSVELGRLLQTSTHRFFRRHQI